MKSDITAVGFTEVTKWGLVYYFMEVTARVNVKKIKHVSKSQYKDRYSKVEGPPNSTGGSKDTENHSTNVVAAGYLSYGRVILFLKSICILCAEMLTYIRVLCVFCMPRGVIAVLQTRQLSYGYDNHELGRKSTNSVQLFR